MSVKKEPVKGDDSMKYAILFELENTAFDGRSVVFGAIEKILKAKDVKVLPHVYSRFGLNTSLSQFVTTVLDGEKKKLAVDKLVAEIREGIKAEMLSSSVKTKGGIQKLIQQAAASDVALGVWSSFDEQTAKALLAKAGINEQEVALLCCRNEERPHISADAWLKLAKNMGVPAGACLTIATCKKSCKASLSAGMRCVVVPDKFTSFQDFGGVDMVADKFDDDLVATVLNLLKSS